MIMTNSTTNEGDAVKKRKTKKAKVGRKANGQLKKGYRNKKGGGTVKVKAKKRSR